MSAPSAPAVQGGQSAEHQPLAEAVDKIPEIIVFTAPVASSLPVLPKEKMDVRKG